MTFHTGRTAAPLIRCSMARIRRYIAITKEIIRAPWNVCLLIVSIPTVLWSFGLIESPLRLEDLLPAKWLLPIWLILFCIGVLISGMLAIARRDDQLAANADPVKRLREAKAVLRGCAADFALLASPGNLIERSDEDGVSLIIRTLEALSNTVGYSRIKEFIALIGTGSNSIPYNDAHCYLTRLADNLQESDLSEASTIVFGSYPASRLGSQPRGEQLPAPPPTCPRRSSK